MARAVAPALFLAAVTIAVLVVRSGFGGGSNAVPAPTHRAGHPAKALAHSSTSKRTHTAPVSAAYYRIQSGDTLDAVSRHFGTSVEKLFALNPGIEPTALHVGQRVRIR